MGSLTCDLEGFKKGVGEFLKALPTANIESLENGMKCVHLLYLNIEPVPKTKSVEQIIAVSTLEFAQRRYAERERELFYETV